MIKYIIDVTSSNPDLYGNRYHIARITSTKTGNSLSFKASSDSNAAHTLRQLLGLDWEQVHTTYQHVAIREFNRQQKRADLYEHQLTAPMIRKLNRRTT